MYKIDDEDYSNIRLPDAVADYYGISFIGNLEDSNTDFRSSLLHLNDELELSFNEIADVIEQI